MNAVMYKPGDICPQSGQYEICDLANGRGTGVERGVTKGEPFPPTPKAGQGYRLVDPTRH